MPAKMSFKAKAYLSCPPSPGPSACSEAFYPGQTEETVVPKLVFNAIEVDRASPTLASWITV